MGRSGSRSGPRKSIENIDVFCCFLRLGRPWTHEDPFLTQWFSRPWNRIQYDGFCMFSFGDIVFYEGCYNAKCRNILFFNRFRPSFSFGLVFFDRFGPSFSFGLLFLEEFGKHCILRTFAFLGPKVVKISMFSVRSCILPRVAPQSYFESNFSRILRSDWRLWRILSAPRDQSGHIWSHFGHPGEHFVVILRISLLI